MNPVILMAVLASAGLECAAQLKPDIFLPDSWLEAGQAFGDLEIQYRLTDGCDLDPDIKILRWPNIDIQQSDVFSVLRQPSFIFSKRDAIPDEKRTEVIQGVFGQEARPNRPIDEVEYDRMKVMLENLGPWPQIHTVDVSDGVYFCYFDLEGSLTEVERFSPEGRINRVDIPLSEAGPFRLRLTVE